jgi:hypothetical protein
MRLSALLKTNCYCLTSEVPFQAALSQRLVQKSQVTPATRPVRAYAMVVLVRLPKAMKCLAAVAPRTDQALSTMD